MLAFLLELQRLKRLDRTGWVLRGLAPGAESVAAHSYGVALTAMLLADRVAARGTPIDIEKVMRMALLHDLTETRLGDLPQTAARYFGEEARRKAARRAFADIIASLDETTRDGYLALHDEYEERVSLESRLVKAADVIDLLAQALAFERAGSRGLDEFWTAVARNLAPDEEVAAIVDEVLREMVRARRNALGVAPPEQEDAGASGLGKKRESPEGSKGD